MRQYTINQLNESDQQEFVDALGAVYENSPWVAERTYNERPFQSIEKLQLAMATVVRNATEDEQRQLLRAHPDLGEQAGLTEASHREQAAAGLDSLSPSQYEAFQRSNEAYREKFGFPFVMAVEGTSPETIKNAMDRRIKHSTSEEFSTALSEVNEIARLRLEPLIAD